MSIQIFNTLTRKKEVFESIEPGKIKMYVCGPTVYDFLHVGNFVGAIFFNVVRRWLEKRGYEVKFVYNYTDVDDKIINRALKEGVTSESVAEKYIAEFQKDYSALHLKPHTCNPRVTEYMEEIIKFVGDLVEKKKAYVLDGDVYFDVQSFPDYGKLSNKNLEELMAGHRVDINDKKRHAADFALWKKVKPGEPAWKSPWGEGRPGWHIECSAMNYAIHGEQIDIHGGGLDLTFPHHENEIAQTEARTGKPFARYWMHNNMLQFGNVKMSKSLGNIRTGRSFIEEYNGEVLKFMVLSSHYRSPIDFSQTQIDRSIANLSRFYSSLAYAKKLMAAGALAPVPEKFTRALHTAEHKIEKSLDDDFNTPEVMAQFYEIMRLFNNLCRTPGKAKPEQVATAETYFHWLKKWGELLSLFQEEPHEFLMQLDDMLLRKLKVEREQVDQLVTERSAARSNKDYKRSDELRDQLLSMGISIQDSAEGTSWEVDKARLQ